MEPVLHDFPLRDLVEHEPDAGGIDGGGSCGGARVNGPVQHSAQNRAGAPHIVGPDVGTAAALFLAAKAPERVTSLTIGGAAVRSRPAVRSKTSSRHPASMTFAGSTPEPTSASRSSQPHRATLSPRSTRTM